MWLITEHKRKEGIFTVHVVLLQGGLWKASLLQSVRIFMPLFTHSPSVCHHYLTLSLLIIAICLSSPPCLCLSPCFLLFLRVTKESLHAAAGVIIHQDFSRQQIVYIHNEFCHWKTIPGTFGRIFSESYLWSSSRVSVRPIIVVLYMYLSQRFPKH